MNSSHDPTHAQLRADIHEALTNARATFDEPAPPVEREVVADRFPAIHPLQRAMATVTAWHGTNRSSADMRSLLTSPLLVGELTPCGAGMRLVDLTMGSISLAHHLLGELATERGTDLDTELQRTGLLFAQIIPPEDH